MRKLSNLLLILIFPFLINCGSGIIALFEENDKIKQEEKTIFVSTTGEDSNPGTIALPVQSIQAGIDLAIINEYPRVHVAGGQYTNDGIVFIMVDGVSLYGGFSQDFSKRNSETIIKDLRTSGGEIENPNKTIYCSSPVNHSTIIDGFKILGGDGLYSMALYVENSSPTIQNCEIIGGLVSERSIGIFITKSANPIIKNSIIDAGSGQLSYGVYFYEASGLLEKNMIIGGNGTIQTAGVMLENSKNIIISSNEINGGTGNNSYGLVLYKKSNASVYNNCIMGGHDGQSSAGIFIDESDSIILNNTIDGGSPLNYSIGIHIFSVDENKNIDIINNIIFTTGASSRFGIYEEEVNSYPSKLSNNNLFNCPDGLYISHDGYYKNYLNDITDVNLLENSNSFNNVAIDPLLKDPDTGDWHFTDKSSASVRDGGINAIDDGYEIDPIDMDGKKRPGSGNPWSIGAYE